MSTPSIQQCNHQAAISGKARFGKLTTRQQKAINTLNSARAYVRAAHGARGCDELDGFFVACIVDVVSESCGDKPIEARR
jgi:hypothetical protein